MTEAREKLDSTDVRQVIEKLVAGIRRLREARDAGRRYLMALETCDHLEECAPPPGLAHATEWQRWSRVEEEAQSRLCVALHNLRHVLRFPDPCGTSGPPRGLGGRPIAA